MIGKRWVCAVAACRDGDLVFRAYSYWLGDERGLLIIVHPFGIHGRNKVWLPSFDMETLCYNIDVHFCASLGDVSLFSNVYDIFKWFYAKLMTFCFASCRATNISSNVRSRIFALGREGHKLVFFFDRPVVCIDVGCRFCAHYHLRNDDCRSHLNSLRGSLLS